MSSEHQSSAAPLPRMHRAALRFLGRDDGLPSGQVHCLSQGLNGVFWLATPSGLTRYDGARFTRYSKSDGFSSHGLRSLAFAKAGTLWVGSDAGLDLVDAEGGVADSGPGVQWSFGLVDCIELEQRRAWVGTPSGLYAHDGHGWQRHEDPLVRDHPIRSLCQLGSGSMFAAVGGIGLVYQRSEQWHRVEGIGHAGPIGEILTLNHGPRGSVLVGGTQGFCLIGDDGKLLSASGPNHDHDPVTAALFHNDRWWVGIGGQLRTYEMAGAAWTATELVADGLVVNDLQADRLGNIWAATESNGVLRVSALARAIKPAELPGSHSVFAVRSGRDGRLLVASDQASFHLPSDSNGAAEPISELRKQQVWDLVDDRHNRLWAATGAGLLRFKPGAGPDQVEQLGANHPVLSAANRALLSRGDQMWVGTLNGCAVVEANDTIAPYPTADARSLGYVYTLTEDRTGRLWIGTLGNGLWRESPAGAVRHRGEGLNDTGNTYAVALRDDGTLAVSQDDRLVLISPDRQTRQLATADEPVAAWSLRWTDDGQLWAGSSSGLTQYDPETGQRLRQLTAMLGLSGWEFTTSRSLYVDRSDGHLLCGLSSGLVKVNPHALARFQSPPNVHLHRLHWQNARPRLDSQTHVLEPGNWAVTAEVFAAWYLDEDDLHYRYQLLGFDADWSPLTRRAVVHYSSLPPGEYRLVAQAYNRLTGYGERAELLQLIVLAPGWASSALAAPLRGFAALVARYRSRDLNRREARLEQIILERTTALEAANARLAEANAQLSEVSNTDALTQVGNRRYFDQLANAEIKRASRGFQPLSLLLIDVDYFKNYNDCFGHAAGDDCLQQLAQALAGALQRDADSLCRYGGEEFAALLPSTDRGGAEAIANTLLSAVADLQIEHPARPEPAVITVSIGITTWHCSQRPIARHELVAVADTALYAAKRNGRNRIEYLSIEKS